MGECNWKRDADFPDGVITHAHAVTIFNHGLVNLRGISHDDAKVNEAQSHAYKIYAITAIRSAIQYSWKAYSDGTFSDKYLAEGSYTGARRQATWPRRPQATRPPSWRSTHSWT